jgi:hypothetical protein
MAVRFGTDRSRSNQSGEGEGNYLDARESKRRLVETPKRHNSQALSPIGDSLGAEPRRHTNQQPGPGGVGTPTGSPRRLPARLEGLRVH